MGPEHGRCHDRSAPDKRRLTARPRRDTLIAMEDVKRPGAKGTAPSGGERRARLAAALRDNLRKRKAQARARASAEATHPDPLPPGEGGAKRG